MDRTTFLRSLLGSTALLTVPPLELFPEQQDRLAWTKDCHHLFLYDCFVRGFRHYEGPKLIAQMKDHEDLDLLREYANEHDPNAVIVYWQGHKLGYLPMGENIALANLIDHGMKLAAYILYTAPELEPWEQCFVGVELLVPASPNFDSYIEDYLERPDAGYKLHQNYGGEDELGPEQVFATAAQRELRQAAALQSLGELRLMRLLEYLQAQGEWYPFAVGQLARVVEKKGLIVLHELLQQGTLHLNLTVVAADHCLLELRMRGPEGYTGGHWEVIFNAANEVERADLRGFMIS